MRGGLEMVNSREGKSLAGYDLCHCLSAFTPLQLYSFTAFMHIIKLLVARRHARALNFPRLACMHTIYCIS